MSRQLARLDVRDLSGVFAARQLGRGLAASLTLERQDQIRVATALSEIGRSAVTAGLTAVIAFGVDDTDLLLTVTLDGEPPAEGIAAAARLMDLRRRRRSRGADDETASAGSGTGHAAGQCADGRRAPAVRPG